MSAELTQLTDITAPAAPVDTSRDVSRQSKLRRYLHPIALLVILLAAAAFRLHDLNWDQNQHLHPDERHVTNVLSGLRLPNGLGEYFDSGESPLNPYNIRQSWVYGTLPLFLDRYLAEWLDHGCAPERALIPRVLGRLIAGSDATDCSNGFFTSYDSLAIAGRFVSALADLLTVLLVYLIGRRLFGWRVGLLASAFSALAVLQIQHAHFAVVESMLTLCVTVCLYFCARIVTTELAPRQRSWRLWANAAFAGAFSGLAVASKISVWPAAALVVLSIVIALMRDRRGTQTAVTSAFIATLIAGGLSFVAFRVSQPYAFVGSSEVEWRYTTRECSGLNAEQMDICIDTDPLPESIDRIIKNIPASLRAIFVPSSRWIAELQGIAAQASGEADVPFGWQWANRMPIVFPLINIVFYGLGLPLGISAVVGVLYMLRQLLRGRRWYAYLIPTLWIVGFFLYQGTQYVKAIRYQVPIYPLLCMTAAVALVALWRTTGRWMADERRQRYAYPTRTFSRLLSIMPIGIVLVGTLVWALAFTQIYSGEITRVQASRWMYENVPTALTLRGEAHAQERQFQLPVPQVSLFPDGQQSITFRLDKRDDEIIAPLSNIRLTLNHVQGGGMVEARVIDTTSNQTLQVAQGRVDETNRTLGFPQVAITPESQYILELRLLDGAGISANTSVIANQHWDEGGPVRIGGKDAYGGYYRGLSTPDGSMHVYAEEDPYISPENPGKLEWMLRNLDEADYLVLFSNRHYASVARLPWRFPMTIEYYRALLVGELGFELAADFHSFPRIGLFVFNDQEMPYALSRPMNTEGTPPGIEVPYPKAEEAFSVYDHPRVLIFRKTPNYSRANAERILGAYDPTRTIKRTAFQSTDTPSGLLLDPKTLAAQQTGGTWSELFPRSSPLNRSQPLAVLAWVALMEALGIAAFMVIAAATQSQDVRTKTQDSLASWFLRLPSLLDGGYSFAKTLGLLLVSFVAWWLGSTHVAPFTPAVIWGVIALLVVTGAIVGHLNRDYIVTLVRTRWPVFVASEALFLIAFLIFLFVRAGNPDLWHPYFGGEKPMDFAYLNSVLKATTFPPQDPWFAGGVINYYYFGFVFIGAPIKALGIDPAVAYNIAIPTLFALTACGAFGLGASFYASKGARAQRRGGAASREQRSTDSTSADLPDPASRSENHPSIPIPRPESGRGIVENGDRGTLTRAILAGVIAAVFVVGVGNGDQIRVVGPALQQLGGVDQGVVGPVAFVSGLFKWLGGAPLPIAPGSPYWNATRLAPEVIIAEFPQFTFLYADLHAHMMAMPLAYLALVFALAYAGGVRNWVAIALGAVATGMLWPTNTWDYPPYVLLVVAGLALGAIANRVDDKPLDIRNVVGAAVSALPVIVVFVVLTRVAMLPYLASYGSAYNSIDLWQGDRTQLNTYITIYGLFLIPIVFYLLWNVFTVRDLARRLMQVALAIGVIAGLLLAVLGVPIAAIATPVMLLAFAAALLLNDASQTRLMWLMTAGAFALTVFVEVLTLRGDIGRMNTQFKFYIQAWLMLGVASAVALMWAVERLFAARPQTMTDSSPFVPSRSSGQALRQAQDAQGDPRPAQLQTVEDEQQTIAVTRPLSLQFGSGWLNAGSPVIVRTVFTVAVAVAFFLAALYPVFAVPAKVEDRYVTTAPRGLDGMAYMVSAICEGGRCTGRDDAQYSLAYDHETIKWMQDNVQGSPTIMEGVTSGQQYTWSNRYSIYTGLPTVIGWQWHQRQQRAALDDRVIYDRDADVTAFYTTQDIEQARMLIQRYKPGYIIVGPLERAYYGPAGFDKFNALVESGDLRIAYQNPGVTIYQVVK